MVKRMTGSDCEFSFQEEKGFYSSEFSADPSKVRAYLGGKVDSRDLEEGLVLYLQKVNAALTGPRVG